MEKVYLATNFFSEAGFEYTAKLAKEIRKLGFDVYVPQENGSINDKSNNNVTAIDIADGDNKYLKDADILVASLDGVEIDSGVSAEIGFFSGLIEASKEIYAKPRLRTIIGIYTDIRRDGEGDNRFYINLYTKGLVMKYGKVVHNTEELVSTLQKLKELEETDVS